MKLFKALRLPARDMTDRVGLPKAAIITIKVVGLLALLVIGVVFPPLISPDTTTTGVAVYALMFAAWATAWNIFSGYTGYIALGHAAFFGTGAYALGILCEFWHVGPQLVGPGGGDISILFLTIPVDYTPFLLVPLAGLIAGLVAVPVGWIALHTRRHTFIVITIAIFFIFQLLAENNIGNLTNGTKGLEFPYPSWVYPFYNFPFYYAMLVILVLALVVSWWVRHSKYGLGLLAIRDDEDRALGLGVRTGPYKLVAYVISAIFAGMLGGVWGYSLGSVFPQSAFDPLNDISLALMAFMGGLGTLSGPIIGALIIEWARLQFNSLSFIENSQSPGGYYLIIYGALFLIVILLLPEGIVPTLRKWGMGLLASREEQGTPADPLELSKQIASVAVEQAETGEGVNR